MGQLNYFKFEVLPFNYSGVHGGVEKTYRITVEADGQERLIFEKAAMVPTQMTELDFLLRMMTEVKHAIEDKV